MHGTAVKGVEPIVHVAVNMGILGVLAMHTPAFLGASCELIRWLWCHLFLLLLGLIVRRAHTAGHLKSLLDSNQFAVQDSGFMHESSESAAMSSAMGDLLPVV